MTDPRSTDFDARRVLRPHERDTHRDGSHSPGPADRVAASAASTAAAASAPLRDPGAPLPSPNDLDAAAASDLVAAFARCSEADPQLRTAVRRWVGAVRDRGVLPERMLVGLTSMLRKASLTSPMATVSGCEWMRSTVVRWAVEDYYRDD